MYFTKNTRCILLSLALMLLLVMPVRASACNHEYEQHQESPTCEVGGLTWRECIRCGDTIDYVALEPIGHTYDEWYVLEEPTCNSDGTQARDCVSCGFRQTAPLPHVGHHYIVEVMPPSCTARGYTSHYCAGCGDRFRTDYTQSLGHRYDEGVITREPTLTAMGRILYTCIGCGDTYQDTIPKLTNPFVDLDKNSYYFDPVIWAVNAGITAGIDETHFAPEDICTRSQVVTFLWRYAGEPEPQTTTNPFTDVSEGSYYRKAVLWAYENGITKGTDATQFSPLDPCTRGQVVTFLHRFHGQPTPVITSVFPDVSAGTYYYKAVLWAAQRTITVGMDGGKFCPDLSCTRGQIVTFLYRDAKNP